MSSRSIARGINGKPGEYLITRTYRMCLGEAMCCASGNAEKRTGWKMLGEMQAMCAPDPVWGSASTCLDGPFSSLWWKNKNEAISN